MDGRLTMKKLGGLLILEVIRQISLDSMIAEEHDSFRGKKALFKES